MKMRETAAVRFASTLECSLMLLMCIVFGMAASSCVDNKSQGKGQGTQVLGGQPAAPGSTGTQVMKVVIDDSILNGITSPEQALAKLEEMGYVYGTEPFHEELRHGREDLYHLYMMAGMDKEAKGASGITPLLAAVDGNSPAIVKALLELGADVMARVDEEDVTCLHAAASGDPIKFMQGEGVDAPTREETMEFTGMHYEVRNAVAIARLLLEHGAEIEARDFYLQTPLFVAARTGTLEVAELLLMQGADVDVRDSFQVTPLMASVMGGNLELLQLLEEHGADINVVDEKGANATWGAVANIKPEILAYLLSQGGSPDIDSDELFPALHVACGMTVHEGNEADVTEIIRMLLENGADVNSRDKRYDSTPLHAAAQATNVTAIKLLLDHGAEINVVGRSHNATPLHFAVSSGDVECVQLLLKAGADIELQDFQGNSVIEVARAAREQVSRDEAQRDQELALSDTEMTAEERLFYAEKINALGKIIELLEATQG